MTDSAMRSRPARRFRRPRTLIVSCEHGGHRVPARYAPLFVAADDVLESHRGHDPGAAFVATRLARLAPVPAFVARTTRLLVDLNRSPHHRALFSEYTRALDAADKARILRTYYRPYRERVEQTIAGAIAAGFTVVHVSSHSFTPVLDGQIRRADVGLLYDPARGPERAFAADWRDALDAAAPRLGVRRNYPYRGVADGFVTALRRRFPERDYLGLELELNQRLVGGPGWPNLADVIAGALGRSLGQ